MPISNRRNGSVSDASVFLTVISDSDNYVGSEDGENRPTLTDGNVSKFTEPYEAGG